MKFSDTQIAKGLPVNLKLAENQEEYQTLPCNYNKETGQVAMAIELDETDIKQIMKDKKLYIQVLTFGSPFQPIRVDTNETDYLDSYRYNNEWVKELIESKKENQKGAKA